MLAAVVISLAAVPGASLPLHTGGQEGLVSYTHQKWTRERDAPPQVMAIDQGRDGFLWLAASSGLYRFDGVRFERLPVPDANRHGAPTAVLVTRNGDVWTSFARSHRFGIYRNGRLDILPPAPVAHRISAIREGPEGSIWALSDAEENPVLRFRSGRWTVYGVGQGIPSDNPFDLVVAADGAVWLSHGEAILRLPPGGDRFKQMSRRDDTIARLSTDPSGRVWISEARGSYPITGRNGAGRPPRLRHPYPTDAPQIRGFSLFDRRGNLWVATEYNGVQRVSRPDPGGAPGPEAAQQAVERFTIRDGLSSNITWRGLADAEGNIWIGTEKGIDKFRPASVVSVPALTDPHVFGDQMLATRAGVVFIAQARSVYRVAPGGSPERILELREKPIVVCEAPRGDVWIVLQDRIAIWRKDRFVGTQPRVPASATIYDCAFDADGDFWISAGRGGLLRLRRGKWQTMFGVTSPAFRPRSMVADHRGHLLIQWNHGSLRRIAAGKGADIPMPFDFSDPQSVALYTPPPGATDAALYLGGPDGVARLVGGHWQRLDRMRVPALANVSGIVVEKDGTHWFAGGLGIVRMTAADAVRAFRNGNHHPAVEILDEASGLKSLPHDHSRRSLVQGGDGRLWAATQSGTVWIDPSRLVRNPFPPQLAIRLVKAGGQVFRDPRIVRLPAGKSDVEIDYAVLSLSNPDRTSVSYRMEGQDEGWIASGKRREAFYTNLPPGRYRFTVIAANEDGHRNDRGASVVIEVPATFFQSGWFVLTMLLGAALVLLVVVRLRSAQVAARMRNRLEQRLMERERIARDLHDTLLQGVQGLIFRIQAVADRLKAGSDDRRLLEGALDRADDLVSQGRDSLRDLRMRGEGESLRQVLQTAIDRALLDDTVDVRISELGFIRRIHPLALTELRAIAGEALFNVGRHAAATRVAVTATYGRRSFLLRIEDNGRGIGEQAIAKGKDGHFGLVGMEERSRAIGGTLRVESLDGKGTLVSMSVPGKFAYSGPTGMRGSLARFLVRLRQST